MLNFMNAIVYIASYLSSVANIKWKELALFASERVVVESSDTM